MQIESKNVLQVTLKNIKGLDPITLFLENFKPGEGKITINCYTSSWTAYWGSMSGRTIEQFFADENEHYLAKNLSTIDSSVPDLDATKDHAKTELLQERRRQYIGQAEARERFDRIEDLSDLDNARAMAEVFGDEFYHSIKSITNPEYAYLCRVIKAVQEGLSMLNQKAAA